MAASRGRRAWIGLAVSATLAILGVALLAAASAVREFDVSLRDGRAEGGVSTLRVHRGETVVLRVRSDRAVSLHVHGYDLEVAVPAAEPATLRFEAAVAGRFPIAAHDSGAAAARDTRTSKHRETTLLYLEVRPE